MAAHYRPKSSGKRRIMQAAKKKVFVCTHHTVISTERVYDNIFSGDYLYFLWALIFLLIYKGQILIWMYKSFVWFWMKQSPSQKAVK